MVSEFSTESRWRRPCCCFARGCSGLCCMPRACVYTPRLIDGLASGLTPTSSSASAKRGLLTYEALEKIDWGWLALDEKKTQAPLDFEKDRPEPYRSRHGAPSAACSLMARTCRWPWSSPALVEWTAYCSSRPWLALSSTDRRTRRASGCVGTVVMRAPCVRLCLANRQGAVDLRLSR